MSRLVKGPTISFGKVEGGPATGAGDSTEMENAYPFLYYWGNDEVDVDGLASKSIISGWFNVATAATDIFAKFWLGVCNSAAKAVRVLAIETSLQDVAVNEEVGKVEFCVAGNNEVDAVQKTVYEPILTFTGRDFSGGADYMLARFGGIIIPPSYTNTTRPTLAAGAAGAEIWNTDDQAKNYWSGTQWLDAIGAPT